MSVSSELAFTSCYPVFILSVKDFPVTLIMLSHVKTFISPDEVMHYGCNFLCQSVRWCRQNVEHVSHDKSCAFHSRTRPANRAIIQHILSVALNSLAEPVFWDWSRLHRGQGFWLVSINNQRRKKAKILQKAIHLAEVKKSLCTNKTKCKKVEWTYVAVEEAVLSLLPAHAQCQAYDSHSQDGNIYAAIKLSFQQSVGLTLVLFRHGGKCFSAIAPWLQSPIHSPPGTLQRIC